MDVPTLCEECNEICEYMNMKVLENKFLCDECYEEIIEEIE